MIVPIRKKTYEELQKVIFDFSIKQTLTKVKIKEVIAQLNDDKCKQLLNDIIRYIDEGY